MSVRYIIHFCIITLCLVTGRAYAWKIEADKVTVLNTAGNTVTHINFRQVYNTPPLVFTLMPQSGSHSAALRIRNVSTTGFDIYTVEPDGNDGPHAQVGAVPYIAVEAGSHVLPDGTRIVAGTVSTSRFQSRILTGGSWQAVNLSGFSTTPTVLAQIQTRQNERTDQAVPAAVSQPWITTAINNVSSNGFDIALERSETTTGTLNTNETIAYLAIDSGLNSGNHYFGDNDGQKIEYESILSAQIIKGWDDASAGYTVNFAKTYSNPIAVATKNTHAGNDGGWLRRKSISESQIALVVDEDIATDAERTHTTERAGILLFSQPFDVDFFNSGQAELIINEVMYKEATTGVNNEEFVELYVQQGGNLYKTVISDQDSHFYLFPDFSVNSGDYVIFHSGNGTDSSANGVHHFYMGVSNFWNNGNDDVIVLKPGNDVTTTGDGKVFNAIPFDYMAYGRNSVGSAVDAIPASINGVSISWNYAFGTELKNALSEQSIALTPNAQDSNKAACWELTGSGNASDNSCSGYRITRALGSSDNSEGNNNTAVPVISLAKSTLTIYDPYNGASNPKAIPGSVLEYIISAKNEGDLEADNNSIVIRDTIPANTRLCVTTQGNCKAPYFLDGTPSSGLSLATVEYRDASDVLITPSADAEGADLAVKKISISMNGAFQPKSGATAPNFEVRFRVIVE